MLRQPRNPKTDKLVTSTLIGWSYFQIGVMQAMGGMMTYFVVMGDGNHLDGNGFKSGELFGLAEDVQPL